MEQQRERKIIIGREERKEEDREKELARYYHSWFINSSQPFYTGACVVLIFGSIAKAHSIKVAAPLFFTWKWRVYIFNAQGYLRKVVRSHIGS